MIQRGRGFWYVILPFDIDLVRLIYIYIYIGIYISEPKQKRVVYSYLSVCLSDRLSLFQNEDKFTPGNDVVIADLLRRAVMITPLRNRTYT